MREFMLRLTEGRDRFNRAWESYGRTYTAFMAMFLSGAISYAIEPACTLLVFAIVFILPIIFRNR